MKINTSAGNRNQYEWRTQLRAESAASVAANSLLSMIHRESPSWKDIASTSFHRWHNKGIIVVTTSVKLVIEAESW